MNATPLLEDLRRHAAPTWLWDSGRGRVVWANAMGIAAFDCDTLFDLIDRPFDLKEPGVEDIANLGRRLVQGVPEDISILFPSTGSNEAFAGKAYLHPLTDGRPGVLFVANLPAAPHADVAPTAEPEADVPQALLDAIPHAAALYGQDLRITVRNSRLTTEFSDDATYSLSSLLGSSERTERALQRLQRNSFGSSIELLVTRNGPREFRVTISRMTDDKAGRCLLLLEDITERRKLERQLSEMADAASLKELPPKPKFTSPEQVFAEIGRQLTDRLAPAEPAKPIVSEVIAETAPKANAESARRHIEQAQIPEAVSQALEQATHGIAICQHGRPVYVTRKALELLGFASHRDALASAWPWDALNVRAAGSTETLRLPSDADVVVSQMPMPWQNGKAEQFSFRLVESKTLPAAKQNATESASGASEVVKTEEPELPVVQEPQASKPAADTDVSLNQELKSILDVVSDGIITLNEEGEILGFSAGAEAIFGAKSGEAVGRPMTDFLAQDSRKVWRDYLRSLSGPGLGTVFNDGREMMAKHVQGGPHPLFVSVSRLQAPHSKAAFCAVVRDISPWKKTERELMDAKEKAELSNRRKSEFIAHISHELRTPLNAILGFSDVMRSERLGPFGNSKYLAYANDIHSSGSHLLAIINDLLDLAKVEAGKLELNFTAVSLEETADYVLRMTREDAASARVIVRRAIPAALPRVVGDAKSLRQVLLNLVSNAIKFTDTGGEVLISAALESNGALALRVKDTGVGMSADELANALQPFGRVEDATRPRPGTGLGLPLTKSLVEANRARFDLHSEPGRGTLAEIIFPGPRVLAE